VKALTLHQPWATLIAHGVKRIETRSWSTSYRGALAIHAAKRRPPTLWPKVDEDLPLAVDLVLMSRFWEWTENVQDRNSGGAYRWQGPLGAVVATCDLVDVLPIIDEVGRRLDLRSSPYPFVRAYNDGAVRIIRDDHSVAEWIDDQRPFGDFTPGRFAWLLDNIQRLDPPIPARGRQGFWEWKT
jgi:hypothetical protein